MRPMAYVTLTIDHRVIDGHPDQRLALPLRRNPGKLANSLDFEQGVGPPEQRLQYELGDIVDGRPRGVGLVGAVVRVTVDDRLHMIEAVDRLGQALEPRYWKIASGSPSSVSDDRRIMKDGDAALRPQSPQLRSRACAPRSSPRRRTP